MGSEVLEAFSQRIRSLREERDLGLRELASILGIGSSTLSQYENCQRTPGIDVCKKFAEYFHVTCDYLLGLTDDRG